MWRSMNDSEEISFANPLFFLASIKAAEEGNVKFESSENPEFYHLFFTH